MSKIWGEEHQKKYLWLYNTLVKEPQFKHLKEEDFLLKINKRNLARFIINSSYSISTKESFYFTILRWLEVNKPNDKGNIDMFRSIAYKLKESRDKREGENTQDEKEAENYETHEYFMKILDSIDTTQIKTIEHHYRYLILSLLTLQAPLRTSFYTTAKFITAYKDIKPDENYILLIKEGKDRAYYIVGRDKVSNSGKYKGNEELSKIEITDKRLVDILYNSYKIHNRVYLFQNKTGGTMKEETFLKYLREITNKKAINVDIMRSSFINWFYTHNRTFKSREELAKKMRHSVQTAQKNYIKVAEEETPSIDEELSILRDENNELKYKLSEALSKIEALSGDDKTYRKRRSDILYRINNGVRPRLDTLRKYDIIFDNETNKYVLK